MYLSPAVRIILSGFRNSYLSLILFVGCTGFHGYFLLIKCALRELDPSAVVPARVKAVFDVLQEGVLILDQKAQIVLANDSFAEILGKSTPELIGCCSPPSREQIPTLLLDGARDRMYNTTLVVDICTPALHRILFRLFARRD